MATIHRLPMPGRDTCAGTCETEAGCTCHEGCAGLCSQGRLSCAGKTLPIPSITRLVMREPHAMGYALGALAAFLVLPCVAIGSALATYSY